MIKYTDSCPVECLQGLCPPQSVFSWAREVPFVSFISPCCPQQRPVWGVGSCHSDPRTACQALEVSALSWSCSPWGRHRPTRLVSVPDRSVSSCSYSLLLLEPCFHTPLPSPPQKGTRLKLWQLLMPRSKALASVSSGVRLTGLSTSIKKPMISG